MKVVKRDGNTEEVSFDKVLRRVRALCDGLTIDPVVISQQVCMRIHDGITTSQLDEFAASLSASLITECPDYDVLASRLIISNLHKNTCTKYMTVLQSMNAYLDTDFYRVCVAIAPRVDTFFVYERDYLLDYFGFKTLEKSYLFRLDGVIVERPQHLFMRVALGVHLHDLMHCVDASGLDDVLASVRETYDMISTKKYTHATPTMFNAGMRRPQMSSCFLVQMSEDSIDGIFDTLKDCALISKEAGGIGLAIHKIRAKNAPIRGTNGTSNGLIPMMKVFNETAKYVDQGGGKRKGSFAVYLEPWHADVYDFLDAKKARGSEDIRARDLFYALWIPDLFMRRVRDGAAWTLLSPSECPALPTLWGDAFETAYCAYEATHPSARRVPAQDLWRAILSTCIETGGPYLLFKDHCNRKSNHQHLGTIQCSNLCTEILQYTAPDETAVCNLASVCLPSFVRADGTFDYGDLRRVLRKVVENLNRVIDVNYYPTDKCLRSNKRHRPVGIGVQGLADAFQDMNLAWDEPKARATHAAIFETMYYAALERSCELAELHGPYDTYAGSPFSRGVLQFDMWGVQPRGGSADLPLDWNALRERVRSHGVRNSLLLAPMPTASTSQIMGFSECFEPHTSNLFVRRTSAGEFKLLNRRLMRALQRIELWTEDTKSRIMLHDGSVQWLDDNLHPDIPNIKRIFKTVWEIKHRLLVDYAAERGAYIDQSQSFNVYMEEPTINKLNSAYFYSWERGLKTCQYYLRIRTRARAIQFTVDPTLQRRNDTSDESSDSVCRRGDASCESCSA